MRWMFKNISIGQGITNERLDSVHLEKDQEFVRIVLF